MKKFLILSAAVLAFNAAPALAGDHEGGHDKKAGMFKKHDTNGDGVISKDEFLEHAEKRFSKMDADSDGNVSKEEAKEAHEKMRAKMKEKMKERRDNKGE